MVPLFFSGLMFDQQNKLLWNTIYAIIIFCFISSSIYLFNDVIDRENDRKHPFKKFRAIALGVISVKQAIIFSSILAFSGLIAALFLDFYFFLMAILYIGLQVTYSYKLKHIAIVDVFAIASGFVIRAYAGGFVINLHMMGWLSLCVISGAMLIAVGKRRAELSILTDQSPAHSTRSVLQKYPIEVLNSYVNMFATMTIIFWSVYTYTFYDALPSKSPISSQIISALPQTLAGHNKYMMATIPIVIYGVMRYLKIIYDGSKAESPERIILTDKPLILSLMAYVFLLVIIMYILA